jgi:hypothetical protein
MARFSVLIAVAMMLTGPVSGRVLDGAQPTHPVIKDLADYLDAKGIDIRNNAPPDGAISGSRPQLTDLRNFPVDSSIVGTSDPFTPGFHAGIDSDRAYLIAVNSPGVPQPKELQEFKNIWANASSTNRVFVSFSGKDLAAAKNVAEGLRKANYIVFLFKNDEAGLPAVNAVETGQRTQRPCSASVTDCSWIANSARRRLAGYNELLSVMQVSQRH